LLNWDIQNVWKQYFENNELQRTINQDIVRTYPEEEFFQSASVRQMMLRVLFVYARLNPTVAYKQGMHELLAPMIFLLHRNQLDHADDVISFLNSNKCK
jgi:TBC1 domain family member 5